MGLVETKLTNKAAKFIYNNNINNKRCNSREITESLICAIMENGSINYNKNENLWPLYQMYCKHIVTK